MLTLLPPNATPFQRDLETINGITVDTGNGVEKIKSIKSAPPDHILSWLIWEYGLGEILPYISDLRRVISDGLQWQRLRGTPQSLKIALGWIGLDDAQIQEEVPGMHFYEYQLKLPKVPTRAEFDKIRNLAELSAPARSRLSRIYNDSYDVRRLIPSDGQSGQFGQILSDYSGYTDNKIMLSCGNKQGLGVQFPGVTIASGSKRENRRRVHNEDHPLLSNMSISDVPVLNLPMQVSRLRTLYYGRDNDAPISLTGLNWYGAWKERTWAESGYIEIGVCRSIIHTAGVQRTAGDIGVGIAKRISIPTAGLADEIDRSHVISSHLTTTRLARENDEPLCSSGTDWFGGWDRERTWEDPIYVHIDVIHRSTDASEPLFTDRLVSIRLTQENGEPLCSAGTDWFGGWDQDRTWEDPLFINIGVIHGNTN